MKSSAAATRGPKSIRNVIIDEGGNHNESFQSNGSGVKQTKHMPLYPMYTKIEP